MAYSEQLAQRVREYLGKRKVASEEKKMMGGLTFMVNGKMCVGVLGEELMVRIDPERYAEALSKKGAKEMMFTGRPMKGFVFVESVGWQAKGDLKYFVELALVYNPKAKPSRKK